MHRQGYYLKPRHTISYVSIYIISNNDIRIETISSNYLCRMFLFFFYLFHLFFKTSPKANAYLNVCHFLYVYLNVCHFLYGTLPKFEYREYLKLLNFLFFFFLFCFLFLFFFCIVEIFALLKTLLNCGRYIRTISLFEYLLMVNMRQD